MVLKSKKSVKKEFEDFANKIARLEYLKHELDAMDKGGFKSEVRLIRAKLKDVNSIKEAENDIG